MPSVFEKLQLKNQKEMVVINAPESFEPEMAQLDGVTVHRDMAEIDATPFMLAFVMKQDEIDALAPVVAQKAQGDAVVWFAYPKGSSKRYKCDFNRDTGWDALGRAGFEGVRQVAIDEDWSALRFRRIEYIKSFTRSGKMALSEQGKARVNKG